MLMQDVNMKRKLNERYMETLYCDFPVNLKLFQN